MSRQFAAHGEYEEPETMWSTAEAAVLANAIRRAPSVHNTQPWSLDVHDRTAVLREREDVTVPEHDPAGRDRRISCGTALTNLALAVRQLGWTADQQADTGGDGGIVATVVGRGREESTAAETRRYEAIADRRSHRRPFAAREVPTAVQEQVCRAATSQTVNLRWISGETEARAVARLLDYAARVFHDNPEYQRELETWIAPQISTSGDPETGQPRQALATEGLGATGLVTGQARLPDEASLASRIQQESVLVLSTPGDDPRDQLEVGKAAEQAWLEATSVGLAVSVMTQPLQLDEVRTGVAEQLGLADMPQILMRFGYGQLEDDSAETRRGALSAT